MRPGLPPLRSRRRKASIEIYFVLYLSAIILLLGTTQSKNSNGEEELEDAIVHLMTPDFRVRAEQAALIYSFYPASIGFDTTGVELKQDSVNLIRASGSFSSVEFRIVAIADSTTGEEIELDQALLVRQGEREAIFQWTPRGIRRTAVYRVTVAGIAQPLPPSNITRSDLRDRIADVLRRRGPLTDSVTFIVSVLSIDSPEKLMVMTRPSIPADTSLAGGALPGDTGESPTVNIFQNPPVFGSMFAMSAANPSIATPSTVPWQNRITFNGVDPNEIDISTEPPGTRVVAVGPNYIDVSGQAPTRGEQQVRVIGTRRKDGVKMWAQFTVRTAALGQPDIPRTVFSGESYRFDFRVADIAEAKISIEVKENGRTVIEPDNGPAQINYTPKGATGNVKFIRYIDGTPIDEFVAEISPLPKPKTQQPELKGEVAIVTTISYGTFRGRLNLAQLIIDEGNVENPEQVGEPAYDKVSQMIVQKWRVPRRDPSKPFYFEAHALDSRGASAGYNRVKFNAP